MKLMMMKYRLLPSLPPPQHIAPTSLELANFKDALMQFFGIASAGRVSDHISLFGST
jgi:hypothetical protein